MAISAFIFVECAQGKSLEVAEKIGKITGVRDAYAVTGPYDVIAFVSAPNFSDLGEVVVKKIQSIPGVLRTLTNIVVE